jgi:hypothetical protein
MAIILPTQPSDGLKMPSTGAAERFNLCATPARCSTRPQVTSRRHEKLHRPCAYVICSLSRMLGEKHRLRVNLSNSLPFS